ncbi:hypothetical protein TeGR_g9837, partial [Tetraparma gracilis]
PHSYSQRKRQRPADGLGSGRASPALGRPEKPSKRFVWPDSLHKLFVQAVFDVGLKQSSPSAILAIMQPRAPNPGDITTERLKSHLQKFRLHKGKSKGEFADSYDDVLRRLEDGGDDGEPSRGEEEPPVEPGRPAAYAT